MTDPIDRRLAQPDGAVIACQVTAGVVGLYEAPDASARLVTQALHGEVLDLYRGEGDFAFARCRRDHYSGWVALPHLSERISPPTHKVSALRTFGFAAPDLKSSVVAAYSMGACLSETGAREGVWVNCGAAGWVHERHLASPETFEADPVALAESFQGTPYRWGGRESLGLDCSGLVQQVFEACGVLLPRDSDDQALWAGEEVSHWQAPGALKRGDLVFWKGHVGILTRPDELLHANAWHLAVAREPLQEAIARIRTIGDEVTTVRRIDITEARRRAPAWLTD